MVERRPQPVSVAALIRAAMATSLGLLVLRLHVALSTGYGDAEALYASYALFSQPAYLDHPGLIGAVARWLGHGSAPDPAVAHIATSFVAALVPWLGCAAARATGAGWAGALATTLALTLAPELSLGLYAMTPDLPLAITWLAALLFAAMALRAQPRSFRAVWTTLGVGAMVGLACLAKLTGVLLGLALLSMSLARPVRRRWSTAAPWCAAALALMLFTPVLLWEGEQGFPMLRHRLITTQAEAGVSLRNLGVLLGGQLAYVSPPFLVAVALLLRHLWGQRHADPVSRMLWLTTLLPGLPLVALCLWSPAAEPHWLAPAYLPLSIHLARCQVIGRRLAIGSLVTGALFTVLAWGWVTTPLPARLPSRLYQARYDLANDLHAWGPGRRLVLDAIGRAVLETKQLPVVVGPHWIVCAQVQALVAHRVPVGCNTPIADDFDRWFPRARWRAAPVVLWVHDSRFEIDSSALLPQRRVTSISKTKVRRGERVVRTIRVTRLEMVSDRAHHGAQPPYRAGRSTGERRDRRHFGTPAQTSGEPH